MNRLIMVEGIPGSGKSTTASRIHGTLRDLGVDSKLHTEGDCFNPTDFAWFSVMTPDAYAGLLLDFPACADILESYASPWRGKVVIPYMRMKSEAGDGIPQALMDVLGRYEPYDGKVSARDYMAMHLERYGDFVDNAGHETPGIVYVFESSFLQNQVNELMGHQLMGGEGIIRHLHALSSTLAPMDPLLIYLLQEDPGKTIMRVAEERRPEDGSHPGWIDHVARYVEESPYGKTHGLRGDQGVVEFFKRRREIELMAIRELPCEVAVFENNGYDVEGGLEKIASHIVDRMRV